MEGSLARLTVSPMSGALPAPPPTRYGQPAYSSWLWPQRTTNTSRPSWPRCFGGPPTRRCQCGTGAPQAARIWNSSALPVYSTKRKNFLGERLVVVNRRASWNWKVNGATQKAMRTRRRPPAAAANRSA